MDRRVSLATKLCYSLGAIGDGLFQRGYEAFAFLYFVSVLGMSPLLGGIAMLISTLLDAVTDPLVGSLSDNLRSRFGRRHMFMYVGIAPFALSWYLLLAPPADLGQTGLFLWFTLFSILLRQSLTLFHVPHMALGAELTSNYQERTSVASWRISASFVGSFGTVALFIWLLFPQSEAYPENGLLNPAGYHEVALYGALLIVVTSLLSVIGTQQEIPNLPPAPLHVERLSTRRLLGEVSLAWQNASFRALFIGSILFVASFSITEIFNPFVRIYFWGLTSEQIGALFPPAGVGFLTALFTTRHLHGRFDKKKTVIVASLLPAVLSGSAVIGRLVGLIPDDDTIVMATLSTAALLGGASGGIAFISAASMMGDVAQEVAHTTGRAVTGVLFAGNSFAQKCSSGIAHFVATIGLEWLALEKGAAPSSVAPDIVTSLGLISLTAVAFSLGGIAMYARYDIDRARHAQLGAMPAAGVASAQATAPGLVEAASPATHA